MKDFFKKPALRAIKGGQDFILGRGNFANSKMARNTKTFPGKSVSKPVQNPGPRSPFDVFLRGEPKPPAKPGAAKPQSAGAFGGGNSFSVDKAYMYVEKMIKSDPALAREVARRFPLRNYRSPKERYKAIVQDAIKYKNSPFRSIVRKNLDSQLIIREEKKQKNSILSTPGGTKEKMMKELKFKFYEGIMGRDNKNGKK